MSDEDLKRFWSKSDGTPVDIDSRDALAPVLAKLSDEQWKALTAAVVRKSGVRKHSVIEIRERLLTRWLLTCSERELAEAVAMVVKEGR